MGIKDGRGYGPYGRGYYRHGPGPDDFAPFGPRCEPLAPTPDWDTQHQLGSAQTEWEQQHKTYTVVMAGLLGTTALLLSWALMPKKARVKRRR